MHLVVVKGRKQHNLHIIEIQSGRIKRKTSKIGFNFFVL